jgi:hypothetical protein
MRRKIFAEFRKTRPDLHHSSEAELREARLDFCCQVLGLAKLDTMMSLNTIELERVIKAMQRQKAEGGGQKAEVVTIHGSRSAKPATRAALGAMARAGLEALASSESSLDCGLQNPQSEIRNSQSAEVIHLAGPEQAWAIERLFEYLGWEQEKRDGFLKKRFKHANVKMLRPRQATGLTRILFNIAAHRDIRARGVEGPISREMIDAEIPKLKKRVGIEKKGDETNGHEK